MAVLIPFRALRPREAVVEAVAALPYDVMNVEEAREMVGRTPSSIQAIRPMRDAEELYGQLTQDGIEVILDDRDERAGVKFKDADLIGIPYRVTVGPKRLAEGKLEIKTRRSGEIAILPISEVAPFLAARIREGL